MHAIWSGPTLSIKDNVSLDLTVGMQFYLELYPSYMAFRRIFYDRPCILVCLELHIHVFIADSVAQRLYCTDVQADFELYCLHIYKHLFCVIRDI